MRGRYERDSAAAASQPTLLDDGESVFGGASIGEMDHGMLYSLNGGDGHAPDERDMVQTGGTHVWAASGAPETVLPPAFLPCNPTGWVMSAQAQAELLGNQSQRTASLKSHLSQEVKETAINNREM